jgi:hypothetical protein
VDKIADVVHGSRAVFGILRHPAALDDSTRYVRSDEERRSRPGDELERTDAERMAALELRALNATSELELLEGRGICGRCGGTGSVVVDELRATVRGSCPRCGGSGRKP